MIKELEKIGVGKREIQELEKVSKNIEKDIQKIKKGTPIQYLIGYVNFYGYNIKVNKKVLIPRPETEFLVEKTITYLKQYDFTNTKVLDLCTGSGAISVALSKEIQDMNIDASDISRKALKVAKINSKLNNANIKFIRSNMFNNIKDKYDLIISNPPYVSKEELLNKEVLKEPKKALFSNNKGLYHIEIILKYAGYYMKNKSILALEINSYSNKEIEKMIKKYFFQNLNNIKYNFEKDLTGKSRYLFIFKNCE